MLPSARREEAVDAAAGSGASRCVFCCKRGQSPSIYDDLEAYGHSDCPKTVCTRGRRAYVGGECEPDSYIWLPSCLSPRKQAGFLLQIAVDERDILIRLTKASGYHFSSLLSIHTHGYFAFISQISCISSVCIFARFFRLFGPWIFAAILLHFLFPHAILPPSMSADPFSFLIGHEIARDVLKRSLASGRLPHALLIVGPEHSGRHTLAETLIQQFLGGPLDTHPDFSRLTLDTDQKTGKEKSAISIEQVRELRERIGQSSFSGRKAAFVEEADCLSPGAANALLKTLEEPKGNALIVLRAPSVESVPATIASRCQPLRLYPVPRERIVKALVLRGLDPEEAQVLAGLSLGAPGRALALLKDGAARAEVEVGFAGFHACTSGSLSARLRSAAALLPKEETNKATVLDRTLDTWEQAARDALLHAVGCGDLASRANPPPRLSSVSLQRFLHTAHIVRQDAAFHVNPLLALEHVLLATSL